MQHPSFSTIKPTTAPSAMAQTEHDDHGGNTPHHDSEKVNPSHPTLDHTPTIKPSAPSFHEASHDVQTAMQVTIWDRFVRFFHWTTALLFVLNYGFLEEGEKLHQWAGYTLGILLILRIIWGFIGSPHARFVNFYPTPTGIKQHINAVQQRQVDPREGHNRLGGAMVIALLFLLSITALSGWLLTWDYFWGEEWLEQCHEISANVTLALVFIHVSAVVIMSRLTGIPLIRTMMTGKRSISP